MVQTSFEDEKFDARGQCTGTERQPFCALFSKNYGKFRAIDPAAGYKLQDQFCGGEVADNSKESDGIWSAWRQGKMYRIQGQGTTSPWPAGHRRDRL